MTKEEFKEFYSKNKVLVWGIPIIIILLILDFFVLKAKRRQNLQPAPSTSTTSEQTNTLSTQLNTQTQAALAPLVQFTPPTLSNFLDAVENRFKPKDVIPFPATKNIFFRPKLVTEVEVATKPVEVIEPKEQNQIEVKYHGYFVLNNYQVALLRVGKELYTIQKKNFIPKTSYYLDEIFEDMVIILDKENHDRILQVPITTASSNRVNEKVKNINSLVKK